MQDWAFTNNRASLEQTVALRQGSINALLGAVPG